MLTLLENVRVLHLEPTDVCQAACPLCARETDPTFDQSAQHWLSVADIKRILPKKIIYQLDKMFMCGNYGDPAAGRKTLEIFNYFRSVNSSITLGMNTNGGLQNTNWWTDLAKQFNRPTDYTVFSIDGLADTNHLYRKNVVWDKVMSNSAAYIRAGGNAHWDMLVYKHNEHQVDECEQLAKHMGFKWFRAKISKRPLAGSLERPLIWTNPVSNNGPIECMAEKEQSIYISAKGQIYPCCWLGYNVNYTINNFIAIKSSWATDAPNPICKATCSGTENSFTKQWQKNTELVK